MENLREMIVADAAAWLGWGGLIIGFVFGAIVYRTNFCAMGSISDILTFGDYRRFRAWLLAGATAILGAQLLRSAGYVDLNKSMYLAPGLNWFGNIFGGLIFGFGMVFAGGCASRNLVRAGAGDLRSVFVVVIIGLFAYMSIGGIIGPLRAALQGATQLDLAAAGIPTQSAGDVLAVLAGMSGATGAWVVAVILAAGILLYCFGDRAFRTSPVHIVAGLGIGLCVVAGWALTGLAYDELATQPQPPVSLTFVRPAGDTIEWLQRYTAIPAPDFAVTSVLGVLAGAFAAAVAMGRFQFTTFADKGDTLRNMFGAALMGIGGVVALGCTIGQAVTGLSTLAIGGILTFAAIVAGGVFGVKAMERVLGA